MIRSRLYLGHEIPAKRRRFANETVVPAQAIEIVGSAFPSGFTTFYGTGRWRGPDHRMVAEQTIVFEILCDDADAPKVHKLAQDLKAEWRQDAVLLTTEPLPDVEFV